MSRQGQVHRRYTEAEDAYLRRHAGKKMLREMAEELGRQITSVGKRVQLLERHGRLIRDLRGRCPWTEEEEDRLLDLLRRFQLKETAASLGRTERACTLRLLTLHTTPLQASAASDRLSISRVCSIIGVDRKTLDPWIEKGWLPIHRVTAGKCSHRFVDSVDLYLFLRERPDCYAIVSMERGPYREHAERHRQTLPRMLTVKTVALEKGCKLTTVRRAIRDGRLRARRNPTYERWWDIAPEDARVWTPDFSKSHR